ncbi:unnamed protein product [Trifolium pratense]|uniref:Uncharacterized protein n=1 Tax=Trifolium pratense TaxID=57577 RepID=A0ACB0KJ64_TRIPR|nr:unnamed protein product [Trifolium pratense]
MKLTLVSFLLCYYYFIYITHASPDSVVLEDQQNFVCLEDQQSLLLQFKNNLTFEPVISRQLDWNNSTDCCDWGGVICDYEGHVIVLNLFNQELISGGFNNSSSLFSLQHLQTLVLSYINFNSSFPSGFTKLEKLTYLDLSHCHFYGTLSNSISNLTDLTYLDLSENDLSGAIPSSLFTLPSLEQIYLENNQFSKPINVEPSSIPKLNTLNLASCNLKNFPSFLINLSTLSSIDLSNNQIQGVLPNWIWKLQSLYKLNISHNLLTELEGPLTNLTSNYIYSVDIHHNQLQGSLPAFFDSAVYLDYSMNKFTSIIPQNIGIYLSSTSFISLSHNNLHGSIPNSLCNASHNVLDLSFNNFSGSIPSCLMTMTETLRVLNLRRNKLQGQIPNKFSAFCALQTLDLNGNLLHGSVPKSLAHCSKLEVLDIGTNQIVGRFPCFLQHIPTLSVLVLRNNKFHGTLRCSKAKNPWKMIQILDIAFNNFSGKLPEKYFRTLKKMKGEDDNVEPRIIGFAINGVYYQDSVTLMIKGQKMELVKILTIFTTIDLSSNHFEGQIPEDLMDLKALIVLNLSNNAFSNEIPSTIGNLKQLESLDLSNNHLVGKIPMQLASLSFLSYLNLSFNHLVGKIPTGTQLQSFQASSFEGNYGLYGPPLTEIPNGTRLDKPHPQPTCGRLAGSIDWNFLSVELGFVFGLGIIIGPIMFWKQWRVRYWKLVDKILCWMFSRMYLEYATDRGQTYTVLRWG